MSSPNKHHVFYVTEFHFTGKCMLLIRIELTENRNRLSTGQKKNVIEGWPLYSTDCITAYKTCIATVNISIQTYC
uniref:Uncharacterized protein n=1 Tax=Anguilla anguilla TaxID=7936 RepID=A0A0E9WYM9_ANGAN